VLHLHMLDEGRDMQQLADNAMVKRWGDMRAREEEESADARKEDARESREHCSECSGCATRVGGGPGG
jgi:hypothetical protein